MRVRRSLTIVIEVALACLTLMTLVSCSRTAPATPYRTFATPEDAVKALVEAAKAGALEDVVAIFGPDGQELADSSDPATARRNRDVFVVAAAERWQLVDDGKRAQGARHRQRGMAVSGSARPKVAERLAVRHGRGKRGSARPPNRPQRAGGHPDLPHLRRRTADLCRTRGHDGQRAGVYAKTFRSDPGRENGLFWPAGRGQRRSPLGDLVATCRRREPAGWLTMARSRHPSMATTSKS